MSGPEVDEHPYVPETWRGIVRNYINLTAGVAGVAHGVYGVNLLTNNPSIWFDRGLQLAQIELAVTPTYAVPSFLLGATLLRIGVEFAVVRGACEFLLQRKRTVRPLAVFRALIGLLRKAGRGFNVLATLIAATAGAYFLLKSFGLGIESSTLHTSMSLILGGLVPAVLLRTNLMSKLLPKKTCALLRDRATREVPAFDTLLARVDAALSAQLSSLSNK